MSLQINYAAQSITTTNTTVKLRMLPLGLRTPATTAVTIAAGGTNATVTLTASAVLGANSLAATTTAALPNKARIIFSNGAQAITTAAVAAAATTIPIEYLSADVTSGSTGVWSAGALTVGSQFLPVSALIAEIDAGEVLTFTGGRVTVTDYCPAGSTVLAVLPLAVAATAAQTATTQSLLNVAGATDATPSGAPKTVDATTYNSEDWLQPRSWRQGRRSDHLSFAQSYVL
jgi:hypothetical protein